LAEDGAKKLVDSGLGKKYAEKLMSQIADKVHINKESLEALHKISTAVGTATSIQDLMNRVFHLYNNDKLDTAEGDTAKALDGLDKIAGHIRHDW